MVQYSNALARAPVREAVEFKLKQLVKEKDDLLTASILFRVNFSLKEYVTESTRLSTS